MAKRRFVQKAAAAATVSAVPFLDASMRAAVWAQGSDAPEKKEVKIGFIPLTDCASVVMASVLEIDKKYGVKIVPTKEASWASVRDKLVNGDIDFAHVLYGLILWRSKRHRRPQERHGGADESEPQWPGHHAVKEAGRERRGRRPDPGKADAD